MRLSTLLFVVAIAVLATSGMALAQQYRGSSDNVNGPTVSPYLNLLNNGPLGGPGGGVGIYQSLVKPLIDSNAAIRRQGGAIQQLQQNAYSAGGGSGTGHGSYFMNYSHYFPMGGGRRR